MRYEFDAPFSAAALADLRESIGWNRMEHDLTDDRLHNTFHLCCYNDDRLIGYVCVVSNGMTDAYIQDLIVHPEYQRQGVGRHLMQRTLERLRAEGIYMVSVIYGDAELRSYYEEFGFKTMLCGQMELRPARD